MFSASNGRLAFKSGHDLVIHDCNTQGNQSGAPLVMATADGPSSAVAIHVDGDDTLASFRDFWKAAPSEGTTPAWPSQFSRYCSSTEAPGTDLGCRHAPALAWELGLADAPSPLRRPAVPSRRAATDQTAKADQEIVTYLDLRCTLLVFRIVVVCSPMLPCDMSVGLSIWPARLRRPRSWSARRRHIIKYSPVAYRRKASAMQRCRCKSA